MEFADFIHEELGKNLPRKNPVEDGISFWKNWNSFVQIGPLLYIGKIII